MSSKLPRRDHLWVVAQRCRRVESPADAWAELIAQLEELSDRDLPKYRDLVDAIRAATIAGRRKPNTETKRT